MTQAYGRGTPDDHLERKFYSRYPLLGVLLLLGIDLVLFGSWGALIWMAQMIWIPFWAAGVINGIGHSWGYRNGQTRDHSRNIIPWGIIVGGEELHNNHHLDPHSPRLSRQWWELDLGWWYIKLLKLLGLAKVDEYWKTK
jgi:stearoyl-CoA desaturase (delta-9 desaturase)